MKSEANVTCGLAFLLLFLCACTNPVTLDDQTGFLSDYSKLERVDDYILRYTGGTLGKYSSFIVDPVVITFRQDPDDQVFTDEELSKITVYYSDAVKRALSDNDGYLIVEEPGLGVAKIRLGITDIDETIGLLNIAVFTKVTGLGLGGASFEGELVDTFSGEQIGAVIRWGTGSRFLKAGITHMGDAKIAIDRWAGDLRLQIDAAHAR